MSPVGQGNDGGTMNLNADVAAAALAGALQAEQMVFLSDVPGLMRDVKDAKTLIREIRAGELEMIPIMWLLIFTMFYSAVLFLAFTLVSIIGFPKSPVKS